MLEYDVSIILSLVLSHKIKINIMMFLQSLRHSFPNDKYIRRNQFLFFL